MKALFLMIAGLVIIHTARAQTLTGKVMENKTEIMLSGITVDNQTRHTSTVTDPLGNFSIKAQKGDLLCFSGLNYMPDTVYLINLKYLTVLLDLRQNVLNEVKIKTTEIRGGPFVAKPQTGPLGSHTVLYKEGGGVKIKLFDSHKGEKKRNAEKQREMNGEKEAEITKAFSPANLKSYLTITGQELANFIIKYKPDIKTFYSNSFNLGVYVSDCYKDFLKVPEEKRRSPTYMSLNNSGN